MGNQSRSKSTETQGDPSPFYSQPKSTDGLTTYLALRIDVSSYTVAPSHSWCHNNPTLRHLPKLISNLSPKFMILLRHPKRWDMGPQEIPQPVPILVTSSGHNRRPVNICLLQAPIGVDIWWLLK